MLTRWKKRNRIRQKWRSTVLIYSGRVTDLSPNDNVIAYNDGSWADAVAFEGTFSERNVFYENRASDSRYGFWLGWSFNTLVLDNTIERNSMEESPLSMAKGIASKRTPSRNFRDQPSYQGRDLIRLGDFAPVDIRSQLNDNRSRR